MRSRNGKALTTAIIIILSISSITLSALAANPGELSLHWTAPGDDGYVGTSNHYIIKYSTSPITELNWASATAVPNPPTPLPAGSIQNITVTGLGIGQRYYIAMKAYDEINNVSMLSNAIQKFSAGITAPTLAGSRVDSLGNATLTARTVQSGLSLYFQFALDTLVTFSRPSFAADTITDSLASVIFLSLRRNDWYYWHCRAMAMDRSDSSQWSRTDSFFVAALNDNIAPNVIVTSPNGGESWVAGSLHNITWNDSDNSGVTAHKMEYTADGTTWNLIRDWTAGDPHTFAWTVPTSLSAQCRLRVSCRDAANNIGSDVSNAVFAIIDNMAPSVTVTSPDGRERWDGNTVHNITWTDTDNLGITAHKLEYSTNSGTSWILVRDWTAGDPHVFAWTVPNTASRSCRVRVSCQDMSANVGYDISNRDFIIHRGNGIMALDKVNADSDMTGLPVKSDDTLIALQGGLIDTQNPIPGEYYLAQSYPNPFNPTTTISYGLPNASHVTIVIYDMLGRKVQNLVDEEQQAGVHQATWNGAQMASGTYLYRIQAGNFIQTMKMQLLK